MRDVPSLRALHSVRRIWIERTVITRASMLERLLACMDERYHVLVESAMHEIPEMQAFVEAAGEGKVSEDGFGLVVGAVVDILTACMDVPQLDRGYVRSGKTVMQHRERRHPRVSGPSFCTSRIQQIPQMEGWVPLSLSTVLRGVGVGGSRVKPYCGSHLATRRLGVDVGGNGGNGGPSLRSSVIINTGLFAWEDVQLIWELKPSSDHINSHAVLSDLIHKATEILHAQWHRCFVLAFLVCGADMKMIWFDRSGVLVGSTIDIREGGGILMVKCILAGLVLSPPDVGLPMELEHPRTTLVYGVPRLVVEVGQQVFVLGGRVVSSPRNHLVCRGTVVHRARRMGGTAWDICHKLSWPYATRPHEGYILEELQGVEGVVKLFAWDVPEMEGMPSKADIDRDFQMQAVSASALRNSAADSGLQQRTPAAEDTGETDSSNQLHDFRPRELRQTVTAYISDPCSPPSAISLLRAWRGLYVVVDAIAQRGWVHRDLSWNNVRITHPQGNPYDPNVSVTLIDFDLASRIIGPVPASADREGTPAFMPLHILCSSAGIRHQELHEDEAAFWIGFLELISRTMAGSMEISRLSTPRQTFEGVGIKKIRMVSVVGQRLLWGEWFGAGPEGMELRRICMRVLQTQFGKLEMVYPSAEERDEEGRRKHEVLHGKVVRGVVGVLEEGIERLQRAAR
ncbi:MAG: hypothetical protein M1840_001433 [Geoglossum simile]|nr:MAG: hypothetical protein M1840_001433 [Geoglossum simile]